MTAPLPAANLLDRETSPYLLQHKDNPVHWRAWGPEALAEARTLNRPILLSVGYAACHWCHVMAHESFEDESTAAVMNAHFVNIKVDREERPDVDAIYMAALQLMNIPGGWPMTMFLTPQGEPFWGGTYFPKTPRHGQPAFVDILDRIGRIYRDEPHRITESRNALIQGLEQLSRPTVAGGQTEAARFTATGLDGVAGRIFDMLDRVNGGFGGAPKFPQTILLETLWRAHRRHDDPALKAAVTLSLTGLTQGGLYDHLGGGFARYATDEAWRIPHFEKMLYDNALILELMTEVWRETRLPVLEARIAETVDWVLREMVTDGGGFAASLDAESEDEEGRYYVWTAPEIDALLDPKDADLFKRVYNVPPDGNWEAGVSVLNRLEYPRPTGPEDESRLAAARKILFRARRTRVAPALDDKILTDWNGLMIGALVEASQCFARPDWLAAATRAFDFVTRAMADGDRLFHSFRLGRARHDAMSDGYAAMAKAALVLFEATGDERYLDRVLAWTGILNRHFWDHDAGGYFYTADSAEALIVRTRNAFDSATPNANGLMVEVLAKLHALTGDPAWRDRADAILTGFSTEARRIPAAVASLWNGFDTLLNTTLIVIVTDPDDPAGRALSDVIWQAPTPTRVLQGVALGADLPRSHPAAIKAKSAKTPCAFVCRSTKCSIPLTDPRQLAAALAKAGS